MWPIGGRRKSGRDRNVSRVNKKRQSKEGGGALLYCTHSPFYCLCKVWEMMIIPVFQVSLRGKTFKLEIQREPCSKEFP